MLARTVVPSASKPSYVGTARKSIVVPVEEDALTKLVGFPSVSEPSACPAWKSTTAPAEAVPGASEPQETFYCPCR